MKTYKHTGNLQLDYIDYIAEANAGYPQGNENMVGAPQAIVVHYSWYRTRGNILGRLNAWCRDHGTFPYHFIIPRDDEFENPTVIMTQDESKATFHCSNYEMNVRSLAICFDGQYNKSAGGVDEITPRQKAIFQQLLENIRTSTNRDCHVYNIDTYDTVTTVEGGQYGSAGQGRVLGHKEVAKPGNGTQCPGDIMVLVDEWFNRKGGVKWVDEYLGLSNLPVINNQADNQTGDQCQELKVEIVELKKSNEVLASQLQNKESIINQLTVQVNQLTNATVSNDLYKQLQKENEELTKETQRLKGLINEFESNKAGIASENQKLLEEIAIEKNKSSGLEKNIEDLSNQLAQASTNASTGEKTIMLGFDPLLEWLWGSKIVRGFIKYDTIVVLFTFLSYQVLPFIQSDVFGLFKGENGAYWQGVIALLIGLITKTLLTSYDKNKDGKLDNSDK